MTYAEQKARITETADLFVILAQSASDFAQVFGYTEEAILAVKAEINRRFPIPKEEAP